MESPVPVGCWMSVDLEVKWPSLLLIGSDRHFC
jgi:hypothetical protein